MFRALFTTGSGIALQANGPDYIEGAIRDVVEFIPRLVGAILILLIGWIVGRAVGRAVTELTDRVQIDRMVLDTPLGRILGGTERAVARSFGTVTRWFVYALAVLAAADALAISLLSRWINTALSYLPAFIAGLLVIVLGFVVADFIGDAITRTRAATQTAYTEWFATGTRLFLYFTAVVIGLDTMGIDVGILFVFARALAWGLAIAIALAVGISFGWGSRDYVADHIDDWMSRPAAMTRGGGSAGRREDRGGYDRDEPSGRREERGRGRDERGGSDREDRRGDQRSGERGPDRRDERDPYDERGGGGGDDRGDRRDDRDPYDERDDRDRRGSR